MTNADTGGAGLGREALIDAALEMLDAGGAEALSMRALADRLGVKAASLYWHVRDKEQLLESVAEAVLERFRVARSGGGWRETVTRACAKLAAFIKEHPHVAGVLLSSLPAVQRSRLTAELADTLRGAGLADAGDVAFALIVQVIAAASVTPITEHRPDAGDMMTLAVDSGSWRLNVRAAPPGAAGVASSAGGGAAATIDVRDGGRVVVRNRRGGNRGAVELNPHHRWYIKLHGGTWQTSLDLRGLRISGIEMDSGAGKVTCILPAPLGIVPIRISSGIMGVMLHRPPAAAVHAMLSSGSIKLKLDERAIKTVLGDMTWDTPGAAGSANRYDLTVYGGCMNITLDATASAEPAPAPPPVDGAANLVTADPVETVVSVLLDGVEHRLRA